LAKEYNNGSEEQQHISIAQADIAPREIGVAAPYTEQGGKHTAQKNKEI
jgi:hypothetical protein